MSKSGFGDHLRREREMRAVSLDEICAATRISTRFLEALEGEHWEVLPGGVFNRGFVRAVSRFLGLDEEGMVAEYAMAMSEQNPPAASSRPPVLPPAREANWLLWALLGGVLLLTGAGLLGWHVHVRNKARQAASQNREVGTVAESPAISNPTSFAPNSSEGENGATGSLPISEQSSDNNLQLNVEAVQDTIVSVKIDGKSLFTGNIPAGQGRTFYAQREFQVSASDAGALSLQLNGQSLPPFGQAGNPGKVTVTRSDLKPSAGGQH